METAVWNALRADHSNLPHCNVNFLRNIVCSNYISRSHRAATLGNGVHFMQTIGSRSKFDAENDGAD